MELDKILKNKDLYFAHKKNGKKDETLEEHLNLCFDYYKKIFDIKSVDSILERILNELNYKNKDVDSKILGVSKEYLKYAFENAIYLHDMGKINPSFQVIKMKNKLLNIKEVDDNSNHSLISAIIYLDIMFEELETLDLSKKEKDFISGIIVIFSYMISRHHGYLKDLNTLPDQIEKLKLDLVKNSKIKDYIFEQRLLNRKYENRMNKYLLSLEKNEKTTLTIYIMGKLLYSLIVACDFYATSEYMNDKKIKDFGLIEDIVKFSSKFYNDEIIKNIYKYEDYLSQKIEKSPFKKDSINNLRSAMFLESEKNIMSSSSKNIYYLEAPTGSGKTITSINLALKTIENNNLINRIFYVFPFNTLVDQTQDVLNNLFDSNKIAKINSISPIKEKDENSYSYNKEEDYLNRIFLHYNIVLTSHVNFFSYLLGVGRESNLPLIHLANSVVILDEIQSYKNLIWKEIIEIIELYAKLLNIKFIIMSATLPKLSNLNETSFGFANLIEDAQSYFNHPKFKNRVELDFSLMDKQIELEELKEVILKKRKDKKRIIVEFINKIKAREFFELLKDEDIENVYELSGDDNSLYRRFMIKKLKEVDEDGKFKLDDVILVATQVIEAGVDIDMDIGFKDVSILDSEEQFIGRINRSCNRSGCIAYFFDYYDEKKIYSNDIRINFTIKNKKIRDLFIKKDFNSYFDLVLQKLDDEKRKLNKNAYKIFQNNVSKFNFMEISKQMKLIDEECINIYLGSSIYDEENKNIIDGNKIWKEYKEILQDMDIAYANKQIQLSKISEKMSYFIYKVKVKPPSYEEEIGNLYYIENGEKYIKNNKFDRIKYNEDIKNKNINEDVIFI